VNDGAEVRLGEPLGTPRGFGLRFSLDFGFGVGWGVGLGDLIAFAPVVGLGVLITFAPVRVYTGRSKFLGCRFLFHFRLVSRCLCICSLCRESFPSGEDTATSSSLITIIVVVRRL
jgi:hypothetical protein